MPDTARNLSAAAPAAKSAKLQAVARPAIRGAVLLVSVNEVRNLVIESYVIDLRNGERNVIPGMTAIHRNAHPGVIDHGHAVSVCGINPHLVVVTAGSHGHGVQGASSIDGSRKRGGEKYTSFSLS